MAVEDLGQKNHEIGSDPYLDFSAPTKARDRVESRDSGRERNADSTARAGRSPDGLFQRTVRGARCPFSD